MCLFTQLVYRMLRSFIEYKASWRGLKTIYVTIYVPLRSTSWTSPIGRVKRLNHCWYYRVNDVTTTRDVIAAWSLALRGLT